MRKAKIERNTRETRITLSLDLDGSGEGTIETSVGFFNHMLELLKKHALLDLTVKCDGDVDVEQHLYELSRQLRMLIYSQGQH